MKVHVYKSALIATALVTMVGCGGGNGGRTPPPPPPPAKPVFTSAANVSVDEQTTSVQTLVATSQNGAVKFSLTGGADKAKFTLTGDKLVFVTAPDFEAPGDAGGDNIYDIQVTVTDAADETAVQEKKITVENLLAPVFTSDAVVSIPEYTTAVTTVSATSDQPPVILALTGGADAAKFDFNATTGSLAFKVAPTYAAPGDADSDNIYDVTIEADDGVEQTIQTLHITVSDVAGADLNIAAAVHDDNGTTAMTDDTLAVYFSVEIDETSLPATIGNAFVIHGTGDIGNTAVYTYTPGWPYKLIMELDGTAVRGYENTTISIANNAIRVASGELVEANTAKAVETANRLFATGQTTIYQAKDDGDYQKGIAMSYTRNADDTVTDSVNGLMWQDDVQGVQVLKPWITQDSWDAAEAGDESRYNDTSGDTATTYCATLDFAGHTDWRLPTIEELSALTVKNQIKPAIDENYFHNTAETEYWSATRCSECSNFAWRVDFEFGGSAAEDELKWHEKHVRCVRDVN